MSEQPGSLAAALVQLQASLPRITKTADGQYGKYADLHVITEAIKPLLIELGLLWICLPTLMDGQFVLEYHMLHAATGETGLQGQYPLDATTPQGRGSEITYARRYALCAALDIAPAGADDDGQAAQNETREWQPPANPRTRKPARHNAARHGMLPADEWTTANEDDPGSISDDQIERIKLRFTALKIMDPADRRAYIMSKLNLTELGRVQELSMSAASKLILILDQDAEAEA